MASPPRRVFARNRVASQTLPLNSAAHDRLRRDRAEVHDPPNARIAALWVLVRELRRQKFRPEATTDEILWRERGDTRYRRFTRDDYERARGDFAAAGREHLLEL
jgi:hypothetical protein